MLVDPQSVSVDFVNASSDVADSLDMVLKLMVDLNVDLGEEDAALLENAKHRLENYNTLYEVEVRAKV